MHKPDKQSQQTFKGPIAWFVRNSFVAHVLTFILLFGGFFIAFNLKTEILPEFQIDIVSISIDYPGSSPEEVEESVLTVIEEEIQAIDGIRDIRSIALEGKGIVRAELNRGADGIKALQDIKTKVDSILSFPDEVENEVVELLTNRKQVISLILYGDQSRIDLYRYAQKVKDDLEEISGISLVSLTLDIDEEIHVEVPQENLRKYHLTLKEIGDQLALTSKDIPGGNIKGDNREVFLTLKEKRETLQEFQEVPILRDRKGSIVTLEDIAEIKTVQFPSENLAWFNGKPAMRIDVFRTGEEDPTKIVKLIDKYVNTLNASLPDTMRVFSWKDETEPLYNRMSTLLNNGFQGFILVIILLSLFLEPRLAFWVAVGIPVSFFGSFFIIWLTGASINMISLFAFVLTIGVVVDDAIIVGDSIYQKRSEWLTPFEASIIGTQAVKWPVFFAVLTNMAAFFPLFFIPGAYGKLVYQIPAVAIGVYCVSLVESLFILPSHLKSKSSQMKGLFLLIDIPNKKFSFLLNLFVKKYFFPFFSVVSKLKYFVLTLSISILIVVFLMLSWGYIPFEFLPRPGSDYVVASVTLPYGSSLKSTKEIEEHLVKSARKAALKFGGPELIRGIYTQIGTPLNLVKDIGEKVPGSHLLEVEVSLIPQKERSFTGDDFSDVWRQESGEMTEVQTFTFPGTDEFSSKGKEIFYNLSHKDRTLLTNASKDFADSLRALQGTYSIDQGVVKGKPQVTFQTTPIADSLNLTAVEIADQIRNAFYGYEALRQTIDGEEIKIKILLPEAERSSVETLDQLVILTPQGGEIPLSQASSSILENASPVLQRQNGKKIQKIKAGVDPKKGNLSSIISNLEEEVLPQLKRKYPGLSFSKEGEQKAQMDFMEAMRTNYTIGLLLIYLILAMCFYDYYIPFLIMAAIPFGTIGAVIGHVILGVPVSMVSMMGMISLSGVVINDNLVLIEAITQEVEKGDRPLLDCILSAIRIRFRQILLTSLTTFFGVLPLMLDTSFEARFLTPMAISLGFGVLFATIISLLLVPSWFLIVDDIKKLVKRLKREYEV